MRLSTLYNHFCNEFCRILDTELLHDGAAMNFYGSRGYSHRKARFLAGEAIYNMSGNLAFSGR
jgi:hypothetical protein